jgi:hypothetical protein
LSHAVALTGEVKQNDGQYALVRFKWPGIWTPADLAGCWGIGLVCVDFGIGAWKLPTSGRNGILTLDLLVNKVR